MTNETRLETFDRYLKTISNHFARYGKKGKTPPTTRTLEFAFETDSNFSDAIAASLVLKSDKSENLKAGLEFWDVWSNPSWTKSTDRHIGRTLSEIRKTIQTAQLGD